MTQITPDDVNTDEKLPYEKPVALTEETFETLALSCARESGFTCPELNPVNS